MCECMTFPDDWREFLKEYSFKDTDEVYTNGAELISVFRVEQLIEHLLEGHAPKLLTLEEVKKLRSLSDGAVWLETCTNILFPVLPEVSSLQNKTYFVAIPFVGYRNWGANEYYGKTWRLWSSKPTDTQRKETKWND